MEKLAKNLREEHFEKLMKQVPIKWSSFDLILESLDFSRYVLHECFTVVNISEITVRLFGRESAFSIPN